jgi:hypothetical protein
MKRILACALNQVISAEVVLSTLLVFTGLTGAVEEAAGLEPRTATNSAVAWAELLVVDKSWMNGAALLVVPNIKSPKLIRM